jgi:hypothetical protein
MRTRSTATPAARAARRRRSPGWVPNQHGAWAMLASPLLLGALASGPAWIHLPLAAFWFAGYFAFNAASLWLKSGRKTRFARPVQVYAVLAALLGLLTAALGPALVRWAPLFLIPLGVGMWAAARRRERDLLAGVTTVVGSALMTIVAFDAGGGTDLRRMPQLRSRTTTHGRNMAGARALWRATGLTDDDFGKPIVAIANSYTQFVPGHVHLKDSATSSPERSARPGGGPRVQHHRGRRRHRHGPHGMLYSLPSRELIADSVEYMVNAHAADALVCISNCDKITPGMLLAALRLNIPTVFVSGGPMEAGTAVIGEDGTATPVSTSSTR